MAASLDWILHNATVDVRVEQRSAESATLNEHLIKFSLDLLFKSRQPRLA